MDCPANFGPSMTCTEYDTVIYQHIVVISKPTAVLSSRRRYILNLVTVSTSALPWQTIAVRDLTLGSSNGSCFGILVPLVTTSCMHSAPSQLAIGGRYAVPMAIRRVEQR